VVLFCEQVCVRDWLNDNLGDVDFFARIHEICTRCAGESLHAPCTYTRLACMQGRDYSLHHHMVVEVGDSEFVVGDTIRYNHDVIYR
jgi:hypothetical protein